MMADALFYIFSSLALFCGVLVVANPFTQNPVTRALFLVLSMIWLAGLFVLLQAYFLAAIQILVYAGAVMVLFLFILMMIDLKEDRIRLKNQVRRLFSAAAVGIASILVLIVLHRALPMTQFPSVATEGSADAIGKILFNQYLLPFEVISVLLLVSMVGVVLISRKERR